MTDHRRAGSGGGTSPRSARLRQAILALALVAGGPAAVVASGGLTNRPLFPALISLLAIGGAATVGGAWYGLASAAASLVTFNVYLTRDGEYDLRPWESLAAAVLFGLTAVAVSALIARERRARLLAVQARAEVEAASERSRRLAGLAAALAQAVTPQQVLDAALAHGVAAAEARAGLLAAVSEDGMVLEVVAQTGYADELVDEGGTWQRFPLDEELPLSIAVRTRRPVHIATQAERDERYPLLAESGAMENMVVCLPLVLEQEAVGGIVFSYAPGTVLAEGNRELELAIANQIAQALGRARLYEVAERAHARASFLAEASAVLSSSLDYETTLARLAELAVPELATWCVIDMVTESGGIERLAVAHQDPEKVAWARQLQERHPPDPNDPTGVPAVIRTGEAEFHPLIPDEVLDAAAARNPELGEVISELGLRSWICVPLKARGRTLGALSLVASEELGRDYVQADFDLARELADRAAVAVDNARLFRESVRRGSAARALAYTGDGVVLLDELGFVRYWNPAAATIAGVAESEALGREIVSVLPSWPTIARHVELASAGELARPTTVPLPAGDGERWVSVTGVAFREGSVYALRDVTAEQALERARSDFVATASHELRTPIAAVYGAVRTLLRPDLELSPEDTATFLQIIETESDRLAHLVQQILVAGQIDAGRIRMHARPCDVEPLVESVLASARMRAPEGMQLELRRNGAAPALAADEDKLRQVLANLVDNAVKYSPDGGTITVEVSAGSASGRIAVHDQGLGIPAGERERIFEKFYRLDPALTRGIGGSGLGLYISRELVERMRGRLKVEPRDGGGSTFVVELPRGIARGAPRRYGSVMLRRLSVRLAPISNRAADYGPIVPACCNVCRTCTTQNVVGLAVGAGTAAAAGIAGLLGRRRPESR